MLSCKGFICLCRYVVYVKEGVYDETVTVTKKMLNVTMYGDGQQKSIITGNKNFVDGVRTFQTASFGKCKFSPQSHLILYHIYNLVYN